MISEEERKSVELLKNIENNTWSTKYIMSSDSKNARTLINLIETQNKMIELMAECFINFEVKWYCKYILPADWKCASKENCIKCIIEYFRNKAKESE